MKKTLPILFLISALLLALAAGCHRAPGAAEARLVDIDTLIGSRPDSALALLAATDTAALAEPDRAYHALLTAQKLYHNCGTLILWCFTL